MPELATATRLTEDRVRKLLAKVDPLRLFAKAHQPQRETPTKPILPQWAKQIDCSLAAMMNAHRMDGPVCHAGSLINKDGVTDEQVARWRGNFTHLKNPEVVGIDLFPGMNVDVVADLCAESFGTEHPSLAGKFGLVFCSALLEHVRNPFVAAKNMSALLRSGGHLYYVGPWVAGYHPYPNDYWRISFEGVKALFPDLTFDQWWYSCTIENVGIEITEARHERKLFAQASVTGAAQLITDRGMPYLNIGAIGRKT